METMTPFLHQSIKAILEIITLFESCQKDKTLLLYKKHTQGAGGDISIGADIECEKIFATHLLNLAHIDSEESGMLYSPHKEITDIIILDPLDGSDNFLSGIPYYGASLALCDSHRIHKEAIIVNFCTKTLIFRSQNTLFKLHLDTMKQIPITTSANAKSGIFEKAYSNPHFANILYQKRLKFRSLGASALSLSLAHYALFVLFLGNIREYDCKAGLYICKDLHIKHTRDFLLISKDKQIFDTITQLLRQNKD